MIGVDAVKRMEKFVEFHDILVSPRLWRPKIWFSYWAMFSECNERIERWNLVIPYLNASFDLYNTWAISRVGICHVNDVELFIARWSFRAYLGCDDVENSARINRDD